MFRLHIKKLYTVWFGILIVCVQLAIYRPGGEVKYAGHDKMEKNTVDKDYKVYIVASLLSGGKIRLCNPVKLYSFVHL